MNPGLSVVTIWRAGASWARHIARQHASFTYVMLAKHMYNQHTEMEEHTKVSIIHLMCRFITLCVADPIWGVVLLLVYTGAGSISDPCALTYVPNEIRKHDC